MEQAVSKYCGYFWAGHFLYMGRCPANTIHMHYALQVIVNREGLFQLRRGKSSIECGGVIVGSGSPHQLFSPDNAHSHQRFRAKYNLPFVLLSDPDHVVAEKYGAWGEKSFMGKKSIGIIRSHFVIDEQGKIVDAQIKVNAKESPNLALRTLAGE